MVIRGTVPMCMYQYERIFSTTRIPGKELDTLEHHDSTYCVVMRKGFYYIMELYNADGTWLSPSELEVLDFNFILFYFILFFNIFPYISI